MCPDDAAPGIATNQSVAIVDYGTTSPVVPFALPSAVAHGNSFAAYDVAGGHLQEDRLHQSPAPQDVLQSLELLYAQLRR